MLTATTAQEAIESVIAAARIAGARGWTPATSGNFSVRAGHLIAITRTGRDKGNLRPEDVAVVPLHAPVGEDLSAETPLHIARYRADPQVGAVFHVHAAMAAVLGRKYERQGEVILQGWELEKVLAGVTSHEATVRIPVLANDQNVVELAAAAERALRQEFRGVTAPGYLVAGHGLNAWGRSPEEAWRHVEGLEALLTLQAKWGENAS